MAVQITTLGFRKPNGSELARSGDNDIAANAQKADDLLVDTRARVGSLEAAAGPATSGGFGLAADPDNPGLYFIEAV